MGTGLGDGHELAACWGYGWKDRGCEGVYCAFNIGAADFGAEGGVDGLDAAFCFDEF